MAKDVNNIVGDSLKQARNTAIFQIGGGLSLWAFKKASEKVSSKVEEIKARRDDDEALASE